MIVKHSGCIGDILYSLPALKSLAEDDGVDLVLVTGVREAKSEPHPLGDFRLTPGWAHALAPLLSAQPYLRSVEVVPLEKTPSGPGVWDMDNFRLMGLDYSEGPCQRWFLWLLGRHADLTQPCLEVEPLPDFKDLFVVCRTSRNRNPMCEYGALHGVPLVFVGLPEEYEAFRQEMPHVPYRPAQDWLELARLLAGSRGFVGNQGAVFALAECLKIPRLLEVPLRHANVFPVGGVALEARNRAQWEAGVERLTARRRRQDYEPRKTLPRVFVHTQDDTACTLYRAVAPCHFAAQILKEKVAFTMGPSVPGVNDYRAVCFQRLVRGMMLKQISRWKDEGKKFVWDTDDDFFSMPSSNPASRDMSDAIREAMRETAALADFVTVTTPHLKAAVAEKYLNGDASKIRVLPNLIDPNLYPPPRREKRDFVRVLWAGSFSHDGDLAFLEETHRLVRERMGDRVQWVFFGYWPSWACEPERVPGEPVFRLKAKFRDVGLVQGVHLSKYPDALADLAPDIALCPLTDDPFNRCKSGNKAVEMALAGAAVVAADLPPYEWVMDGGMGYRVATDDAGAWADAVCDLASAQSVREGMNYRILKEVHADHSWWSAVARRPWVEFFEEVAS